MIFPFGAGRSDGGSFPAYIGVAPRHARPSRLSRLLVSSAFALLLLPAACKGPTERADAFAQRASQLAEAGDRIGALTAIQQAIALRDDNAAYFMLQASIELRSNHPVEAFVAARSALDLDAANVDALSLVSNIGMQIGQIDESYDAATRLLVLDPASLIGLQSKGLYELFKNRYADAEATAQRLLQISPSDTAGIIIHARVMARTGKLEDALAFINDRLAQTSPSPALVITQLNLYRSLGKGEEMLKSFEMLNELAPSRSAALRIDEINLLYQLGRTADARARTMTLLTSGSPDVGNLATLQRLWWQYDPKPFDQQTLQAAKEWGDPVVLFAIGRYFLWQGEPQLADDAFFAFPEALRSPCIAIHLRAQFELGDATGSRAVNDKILERDGENVDGLLLRAEFEARDGRLDRAIESVQRALNVDQTNPEIYVMLAELNAKAGDKGRARQTFEEGLQQMPQDFLLIQRYTQFLHQSGNKSRAVSVSRAFARALPSSTKAWTIMAQQCAWAADAACAAEAAAGRTAAATRFRVDDLPGAAPDRGLLGKF
jgi:tetratricopeptide (TPR) repeat protein